MSPIALSSATRRVIIWSLTLLLSCGSAVASADPFLFESGSPEWVGPGMIGADYLGYTIGRDQLIGFRFQVSAPVLTSAVGANVFTNPFSDDTAFMSLVRLTGPNDMPDSTDLSTSDVLKSVVISPLQPYPTVVQHALEQRLDPGWYAVVVGAGLFGASDPNFPGVANLTFNPSHPEVDRPDAFVRSGLFWGAVSLQGGYVFAAGRSNPAIPEPTTVLLFGTGMIALGTPSLFCNLRRCRKFRKGS
jgi:hypothetical protein